MSAPWNPGALDLAAALALVHLEGAAAVLPAWLARAAEQELSYADFLQGLLDEEMVARSTTAAQRRLRDAAFPFAATMGYPPSRDRAGAMATRHPLWRSNRVASPA